MKLEAAKTVVGSDDVELKKLFNAAPLDVQQMTPRQVFNGIAISVGLYVLTFVGLWEWVPYAFMVWYLFLKDWREINDV